MVSAITFSEDGRTLLSAGQDGTLCVWDVGRGKPRRQVALGGPAISCAALPGGGKVLALGRFDKPLELWDVGSAKALRSVLAVVRITGPAAWAGDAPPWRGCRA